ncbi:MAG: hypothetical protein NWE96_02125 [Candidatus Bathyarchaeota archaeon]|nr:hypothetical protein [Candidatus Bathyarchaeota archaeon]
MLKKLATILVANAILIGFFVWTSYAIANQFNSHPNELLYVHWNLLGTSLITYAGTIIDGTFIASGATTVFVDFPFWLFFTTTTLNLIYIVKLLREQETQKKKPQNPN